MMNERSRKPLQNPCAHIQSHHSQSRPDTRFLDRSGLCICCAWRWKASAIPSDCTTERWSDCCPRPTGAKRADRAASQAKRRGNSRPVKINSPARKTRWRRPSRHCRQPSGNSVRRFHRRQHLGRPVSHHPNRGNRRRSNGGFGYCWAALTLLWRRSSLRRWAHRIEPRLLLVAQRGVEVLQVRPN